MKKNPHNPVKKNSLTDPKTNEDFNKQKPGPKSPDFNTYDPNTEVPLIGDDDKEITEDVTMDEDDNQGKVKHKDKQAGKKRMEERDSETKTEDSHS